MIFLCQAKQKTFLAALNKILKIIFKSKDFFRTMCFTQEMSAVYSGVGLLLALYVYQVNGSKAMTAGILYFVAMEVA